MDCPIIRISSHVHGPLSARPELLPDRPGIRDRAGKPLGTTRLRSHNPRLGSAHRRGIFMTTQHIAAALQRVESVMRRRPELGVHDDAPATARWEQGTRVVALHANGTQVATDMPSELGGTGDKITPGWLFRAGLASCAATSIALAAAAQGIELTTLEVHAGSRSDVRGMLGMTEADGTPVGAGPSDVQLQVRIAATGVDAARLRALVDDAYRRSPIPNAVLTALPVELRIDVDAG